MGRKKQGNGRDSNSKRLGTKIYGGQTVVPGNIIVRQKGTRFHPGAGARMGRDFTIYSMVEGTVCFTRSGRKSIISVVASPQAT